MSMEAINAERRARMGMERRLGIMESRAMGQWLFPMTLPEAQIYRLRIGQGNTLATSGGVTFKGVKQQGLSAITSVPTASPTISGAYADGLTGAYSLREDWQPASPSIVWVLHGLYTDAFGVSGNTEAAGALPEPYVILSRRKVTMTVAAGGTTQVYIPWR